MKKLLVSLMITVGVLVGIKAQADELAFNKLKASTVHIAIGTGFVLKAKSGKLYMVTNWHVCNSGAWHNRMVGSLESGKVVEGPIVKSSPTKDLCAVALTRDLSGVVGMELAPLLERGQSIYTRGYPFGVLSESQGHYVGIKKWVTMYPIEVVGKCFEGSKEVTGEQNIVGCAVQYESNTTEMYVRPGSSGSPVANSRGQLVGVMSSWDSAENVGGMVRLQDLRDFTSSL